MTAAAVVIPNWNGARWIEACLDSVMGQDPPPDEVLVVDNGSTDGSDAAAERRARVEVLRLGRNTGFAAAANRGIAAVSAGHVALVNTDVVLAPDWLRRAAAVLDEDPGVASVATKMVDLEDPSQVYDTGDLLRRDGACEQRGRRTTDNGRFDAPGEAFSACAGAAVYRRDAVLAVGGFDETLVIYLEDVDLGLRLRLAGLAVPLRAGGRAPRGGGLLGWGEPLGVVVDPAQHVAAGGQALPGALASGGRLPPGRVALPRGPRAAPRRPPEGLGRGGAAPARRARRPTEAAANRHRPGGDRDPALAPPRARARLGAASRCPSIASGDGWMTVHWTA